MGMLDIQNLQVRYGSVEAVRDISLSVEEGEIFTLVGPNGAGKSSTLLALSGLVKSSGTIRFRGQDIHGMAPERIVRSGLVQVPEGRAILSPLTVQENLDMGAWVQSDRKAAAQDMDMVFGLFPRLAERRTQLAGSLSGGEQQMLAIGRALMSRPRLLVLDEPSMGLAPLLIQAVFDIIVTINRQGTTVLLVEQNARKALSISHRAAVLSHGRIVHQGESKVLAANPELTEAFLGKA